MVPYPTSNTRFAAHWVEPGAERNQRGDMRKAVCGEWVTGQRGRDSDYGPDRPVHVVCAEAAAYPYPEGGDGDD